MLHATEVLGAAAHDAAGNFVGKVKEMFIVPSEQPNRISYLLLGRGQYQSLVARYDQVSAVEPGKVKLSAEEAALELYKPNEAWLAVRKDLLDQQIIDTNGRKVVRVNDVDLTDHSTNGTTELRVAQVDVGLQAAVGRLLHGLVPPVALRRLQEKLPARTIRWEFVNLIEPDPLRRVKLRLSSDRLAKLHPADLAELMEEISPAERQTIFDSLDEEVAAETMAELDERIQTQVVENLDPAKAADILEEMNPDAAADLIANLARENAEEVLGEMEKREASEVTELLRFDENTAGGMMNTELVVVGEDATRGEVLDYIRFHEIAVDQLDNIVLINREAMLSGTVPIARLILASAEERMADLAFEPLLSVRTDASDGDVYELFDKYDLRGLTVVNDEGRPLGAITVDDVVSRLHARI